MSDVAASLRALGRSVLYRTPLHALQRWVRARRGGVPEHRTQAYWDAGLAGRLRPYLGGTVSVDVRNAVTVQLLRHAVPNLTSLLDVGCAAASLAEAARPLGVRRYVGVDISRTAIESAPADAGELHVSDLHSFDPQARGPFDAIVLNEVLYYAEVDDVLPQMARYARALTPDGVFVVGMKDDPKSRAILARVLTAHEWVDGVVWQEQRERPGWSLRRDRERQPYLVGVVRPVERGDTLHFRRARGTA